MELNASFVKTKAVLWPAIQSEAQNVCQMEVHQKPWPMDCPAMNKAETNPTKTASLIEVALKTCDDKKTRSARL